MYQVCWLKVCFPCWTQNAAVVRTSLAVRRSELAKGQTHGARQSSIPRARCESFHFVSASISSSPYLCESICRADLPSSAGWLAGMVAVRAVFISAICLQFSRGMMAVWSCCCGRLRLRLLTHSQSVWRRTAGCPTY